MSIERILVPVEFSDRCLAALEYALALAHELGADEVEAFHVWAAPDFVPPDLAVEIVKGGATTFETFAREDGERRMAAFLAGVEVPGDVRLTSNVVMADPVSAIIAHAVAADLVVMAKHVRGGFERLVLGSVTERVIRECPRPVITAPTFASTPLRAGSKILLATDFSPSAEEALVWVSELAAGTGATVDVVHVLDAPASIDRAERWMVKLTGHNDETFEAFLARTAKERMARFLEGHEGLGATYVKGEPAPAITGLAASGGYSLVAIGTHGLQGVPRWIVGSVALKVARTAPCPVLTVRRADPLPRR